MERRYQDAATFERALEQARLRLPRDDEQAIRRTPAPQPAAPTPLPRGVGEDKARSSRAEGAYRRAIAADEEGAPEFARQSAMEALADDPGHEDARALLARLNAFSDVEPWLRTPTPIPEAPARRPRRGQLIGLAAGLTLAVIGFAAFRFHVWSVLPFRQPDVLLTVSKPTGGTISSVGIRCGTLGDDCSTRYRSGEAVDFQVQADARFVFAGFTGDCAQGGRTTMTAPRTCGAKFDLVPEVPPRSGRAARSNADHHQAHRRIHRGRGDQVRCRWR